MGEGGDEGGVLESSQTTFFLDHESCFEAREYKNYSTAYLPPKTSTLYVHALTPKRKL